MKKLFSMLIMLLVFTSSGAVCPPKIYQSNAEGIQDVIMTNSSPYIYWSAYTLVIYNLKITDVIHVTSQAEVTNIFGFPVMVGWFLSNQTVYGGSQPSYIGKPPVAQDLAFANGESGQVHMVTSVDTWVTGYSGTTVFSLILYAASGDAYPGANYLKLEHGYGLIQAAVFS